MNATHRTLDARGLACPEPVILTRKALAEGGFETLEVVVDNDAARENVLKFAEFSRCPVARVEAAEGVFRLWLATAGAPAPAPEVPSPASAGGAVVLVATEAIGRGDDELGRLLMRGFLFALTECEPPPLRVILMNGGVKLAVEGAESLVNLRRLADAGVEILACGTCLEFFGLKASLAVGRVSNMYEIAGHLLQGPAVTLS